VDCDIITIHKKGQHWLLTVESQKCMKDGELLKVVHSLYTKWILSILCI